jgi:hypothetical protein
MENQNSEPMYSVKKLHDWFANREMRHCITIMNRRHPNRDELSHYEVYAILVDTVGILTVTLGYIYDIEKTCVNDPNPM